MINVYLKRTRAAAVAVVLMMTAVFNAAAADWAKKVYVELGYGLDYSKWTDGYALQPHSKNESNKAYSMISPSIGYRVSDRFALGFRATITPGSRETRTDRFNSFSLYGQYAWKFGGRFNFYIEPGVAHTYNLAPSDGIPDRRIRFYQTGVSCGVSFAINDRFDVSMRYMYFGALWGSSSGRYVYTDSPGNLGRGRSWALADFGLRTLQLSVRFYPFK